MLPRDHFVSRFSYFTTVGVKCRVAALKGCPVLHFSVVIFDWSFRIIDASIIKSFKSVLGGVRDVALIHYPS
jgi:hypothetical protein